ncbi:MAG TPA: hypothetical protein VGH19_03585 [Verrucomicrobiae bacterium]
MKNGNQNLNRRDFLTSIGAGSLAGIPLAISTNAQEQTKPLSTFEAKAKDLDNQFSKHQSLLKDFNRQRHSRIATFEHGVGLTRFSEEYEAGWRMYYGALRTAISGGTNWKNLQLTTVPERVEWDNSEFGPYYFHKHAADHLQEEGATYKKTSKSFTDRYQAFIRDITRPPIDEAAYAEQIKMGLRWSDEMRILSELEESLSTEWMAFDARQRQSFPNDPTKWRSMAQWYEKNGDPQIDAQITSVNLRKASWLHWVQKAFGGGEAIYSIGEKFDAKNMIEVSVPGVQSGQPIGKKRVFPYQISSDFPDWLKQARQENAPNVEFTIRQNSQEYDYRKQDICGGVGVSFGFFGFFAGAQRQSVAINTKSSSFSLNFKATLKVFDISPGAWYDSTAFEIFSKGPFNAGSPMDNLLKRDGLVGPGKFISHRPSRAIIAYKPKVTVRVSKTEYQYFHEVTRGGGGFFIGPFAIGGGSYYDEKKHVQWNERDASITIHDGPDAAMLLAMDSEPLY